LASFDLVPDHDCADDDEEIGIAPFFLSRFDDKVLARLQADRLKRVNQARTKRTESKTASRFAARYDDLD
jgi:hypothetical protein